MRLSLSKLLLAVTIVLLQGATSKPEQGPTTPAPNKEIHMEHHDLSSTIWYQGTVEQAFAKAHTEKKPLFLYWGAVWCPPCNEIKSQVFSKPRFAELMAPFIAVYIDGDSERAQVWSDKLNVFGYPSLVIFNADGKEVVRLSESVNLEEFEIAVASVLNNLDTLNDTIQRCLANHGQEHDWKLLAYVSWGSGVDSDIDVKTSLQRHQQLISAIPPALDKEKMLLTLQLLSEAFSNQEDKAAAAEIASIKAQPDIYLDRIFSSKANIIAARNFLVSGPEIMGWLFPTKSADSEKYKAKWLAAAQTIAADDTLSIDVRMSAVAPALQFYLFEHGAKAPIASELVSNAKQAVSIAMSRLSTNYERHAVVSSAAALLMTVGDFEGAHKLLTTELKTTDTPWYYYSALVNLEQERSNYQEALKYASLARESAKGRATKLQWIASDLLLSLEYGKNNDAHVLALIGEFYETVTALDDGFRGRNYMRVKKIAKTLKPLMGRPPIKERVTQFATRCDHLTSVSKERCQLHFKGLL